MSKQYGLIKPDKSKKQPQIKNIFGDSSSEDEAAPKKKPRTTDVSQVQKKLAQRMQEEALAEDPNIFKYDEVYEQIENKRKEEKQAKKSSAAQGPKYIKKLLETAESRKKEHERRVERQVQKEREAEGEQFKDKESFVTSAYRKKLEEMKEAEEADKREAYLESIGDVTKQQNMDGFYRHLYEQKMSTEETTKAKTIETAKSTEKLETKSVETKKKNYRKRKSSADQNDESDKEESEILQRQTSEKAHLVSNLDADSDFSIDSSDSEDESKKPDEKVIKQEEETKPEEALPAAEKSEPVEEEEIIPVEPPKPKIDIWKKRTVGEAYDEALQRYYERKAERNRAG